MRRYRKKVLATLPGVRYGRAMRQEGTIRQVAAKLDISLSELCRRAKISDAYLQDLMHGRALPSHGATKRLVLATGGRISFDEIMQWERAPEDPTDSAEHREVAG